MVQITVMWQGLLPNEIRAIGRICGVGDFFTGTGPTDFHRVSINREGDMATVLGYHHAALAIFGNGAK